MNIKTETKNFLKNAVDVASLLGIEAVVIDEISLRGSEQINGVCMILPTPGLDLELPPLGITRISVLKARLNMFENCDIKYTTTENSDNTKFISFLDFSKGRSKASYKCGNPAGIKAAKAINDSVVFSFLADQDDIVMISRAVNGMKATNMTFVSEDDNVFVKFSDTDGDVFTQELKGTLENSEDTSLGKTYAAKKIKSVFNILDSNVEEYKIEITKRGVFKITIKGIPVYIFPEK